MEENQLESEDNYGDDDLIDVPEDLLTQHPLHSRWTFYCLRRQSVQYNNYTGAMEVLGSFQTVEHFWKVYDHIIKPNDVKGGNINYHLFKNDIKPAWEDKANKDGGKWLFKLKKGLASKYWEDLVMAVIGEQFDVGSEICGIVISMRSNEDRIGIWNKNADNQEAIAKIRDHLKRILNLPYFVSLEYQVHHDRVEAVTAPEKSGLSIETTPLQRNESDGSPRAAGPGSWGTFKSTTQPLSSNPKPYVKPASQNREGTKEGTDGPGTGGRSASNQGGWKTFDDKADTRRNPAWTENFSPRGNAGATENNDGWKPSSRGNYSNQNNTSNGSWPSRNEGNSGWNNQKKSGDSSKSVGKWSRGSVVSNDAANAEVA